MLKELPPDLKQFVQQELANGHYQSIEDVICEGLRLLREQAACRETKQPMPGEDTASSSRTAEDVIGDITHALETGEFGLARRLASAGVAHYPDHIELQKYARVLAPPEMAGTSPSDPASVKANNAWLKAHWKAYAGQWIAIRDGHLISADPSFDQLVAHVGDTRGVLLTRIHA